MRDFRELKVWQKAHRMTLDVYEVTKDFPREERYGLTSQLRRSSSSIPANIAEGCGKTSVSELGRYLQVAMGSSSELEYHLLLARDLKLLNTETHDRLSNEVSEVRRMLLAFARQLKIRS